MRRWLPRDQSPALSGRPTGWPRCSPGSISDLLGAAATGIRNLVLITGDPPTEGPYADAEAIFDIDAIGLTNVVRRFNRGLDPGGNPLGPPTSFVIGVAANPDADDLERELDRLYWKVEAGADFVLTQPVFDAEAFARFLELAPVGEVPILAGIAPPASVRQAEFLAHEVPGIVVPEAVLERMRRAQEAVGDAAAREEGGRIAREVLEAVRPLVRGVHLTSVGGRGGGGGGGGGRGAGGGLGAPARGGLHPPSVERAGLPKRRTGVDGAHGSGAQGSD